MLAKGDARLTVRVGPAVADEERAALYVRHKFERGLTADGETREVDVAAYRAFLVETCCDTVEFACRAKGELVAVAVADRGAEALSAVYCAFAPNFDGVSLGTYCILKQIEACRAWGLRYLYLGLLRRRLPAPRLQGPVPAARAPRPGRVAPLRSPCSLTLSDVSLALCAK